MVPLAAANAETAPVERSIGVVTMQSRPADPNHASPAAIKLLSRERPRRSGFGAPG